MSEAIDSSKSTQAALLSSALVQRKKQLSRVKNYIPLKTYHLLEEKVQSEEKQLLARLGFEEKKQAERDLPQTMPKIFFEQRYLKPRTIRID